MALNTGCNEDPTQRYWMQITDRPDLEDGPLLSPKLPRLTPGYDLVSQVQPGTAAALRAVSWAKAPGVVDVILLRDGRM